jgi:anti-anti-sigma regulatory factor
MYEIEVEKQNSTVKIKLTGSLIIQDSPSIKEAILKSLNQTKSLMLNHEKVEEIDLSYLQILISLQKTALSLGKIIMMDGSLPESFIRCLKESGLSFNTWIAGELYKEIIGITEYE